MNITKVCIQRICGVFGAIEGIAILLYVLMLSANSPVAEHIFKYIFIAEEIHTWKLGLFSFFALFSACILQSKYYNKKKCQYRNKTCSTLFFFILNAILLRAILIKKITVMVFSKIVEAIIILLMIFSMSSVFMKHYDNVIR